MTELEQQWIMVMTEIGWLDAEIRNMAVGEHMIGRIAKNDPLVLGCFDLEYLRLMG